MRDLQSQDLHSHDEVKELGIPSCSDFPAGSSDMEKPRMWVHEHPYSFSHKDYRSLGLSGDDSLKGNTASPLTSESQNMAMAGSQSEALHEPTLWWKCGEGGKKLFIKWREYRGSS